MTTEKNTILFLSSWYPNRLFPTLGNFNEKFAQAAALYNNVIAIYVTSDHGMKKKYEIDQFISNRVNTYIWYFRRKNKEFFFDKFIKHFRYLKYYLKAYSKAVKEHCKPNVVHLNIIYPVGIISLILKFRYGVKFVISENWTGYLPQSNIKQNFFTSLISRYIVSHSSVLMPVTENLKSAMINKGLKAKYTVIPNVTDIKYFYPDIKREVKDKKIILHVSTLQDDHKNISGILRVIHKLSEKRKDFMLHIVGDGNPAPHIKTAEQLGLLNTFVRFSGQMTTEEIAQTMRQSDFFVLFSNFENLPCVIVEAFASGLPVVSSDAGGISEHIDEDKGLIVKPLDENGLLKSIDYMLDNFHRYDKMKLFQYAKEYFSYETIGQRFTGIYNEISGKQCYHCESEK